MEDNEDDAELLLFGIAATTFDCKLHFVTDGEQALRFLRREAAYKNAPRPDVIFLDINLPRMNGGQVLSVVNSDDSLRQIPVVVLSTSELPVERQHCDDNGVHAFFGKPLELDKWREVAQTALSACVPVT